MGKTIILVSHSLSQVEEQCDRVILLEKGKMTIDGKPAEAIKAYLGETTMEEPVLVEAPSPRAS
jgi:ABC-type polysaccharide/polyol phosphate transport system ATPase subunit